MCTVTVLTRGELTAAPPGFDPPLVRVACNRDERISRAAALPPCIRAAGDRRAIYPLDPESDGTWIAATDARLVFVLLNANPVGAAATAEGESRGRLIPSLLAASSVSDALGAVLDSPARRYRPFRLLMMDGYQLAECWKHDGRVRHRRTHLHGALMRTSSSLGDAVVETPRRALFRQFFRNPSNPVAAQDAFHDHCWPGQEAVSVRMRRDNARTVSQCVVELSASFATMTYRATGSRDRARVILPLAGAPALAAVRQCS